MHIQTGINRHINGQKNWDLSNVQVLDDGGEGRGVLRARPKIKETVNIEFEFEIVYCFH